MNSDKIKLFNKLSLNTLIDLNKKELSMDDRKKIIDELNKRFSYSQISLMTGVPKSTLATWVMRGKEQPVMKKRKDIQDLIDYFTGYKPQINEWGSLETLRNVLNEILEVKSNE